MRILKGIVVDGRVVVEGPTLSEGLKVLVIVPGLEKEEGGAEFDEEMFRLTREQQDALADVDAAIARGASITTDEVLAALKRVRPL
jgi:2-iminoacetate synthase ThiH